MDLKNEKKNQQKEVKLPTPFLCHKLNKKRTLPPKKIKNNKKNLKQKN